MIPLEKKHIDGKWLTTEHEYRGFRLVIKSREGRGIKIHAFDNDKVLFTLRYSFIKPDVLLDRAKDKIDKLYPNCTNTHCESGIVGELYGEKIHCADPIHYRNN